MRRLACLLLTLLMHTYAYSPAVALEIRLGVATRPGSNQNIVALKFKELIEQRAERDIEVRIIHSCAAGNEAQVVKKIQDNELNMGVVTSGAVEPLVPMLNVVSVPFLFQDAEHADMVLDGLIGEEILSGLTEQGLKGLAFSENGFRNLTNNRRPVRGPQDLKGLKIRVMESPLHEMIWRTLGADPVAMPWPIDGALESRRIDGQENPLWVLEVYEFYKFQKYLSMTRHVYSAHVDVASLVWWNTLDEAFRDSIQSAMRLAAQQQRSDNRAKNADRLALVREKGMVVMESPDINAFTAKLQGFENWPVFQQPQVQAMLEKIRAAAHREVKAGK